MSMLLGTRFGSASRPETSVCLETLLIGYAPSQQWTPKHNDPAKVGLPLS